MSSPELVFPGNHLYVSTLQRWRRQGRIKNGYLLNHAPAYPRPELHVTHVSHSTDLQGLEGISDDGGFRDQTDHQEEPKELKVVWFSLTVSPEELREAESRSVTVVHPDGEEEELEEDDLEQDTLQDFATSPAFRSSSRYGPFRFTFSLEDVLDKYSQQFCGGAEPVLRVYRTVLYKQEVMYAVLVHSPINNKRFHKRFPLLEESSICEFESEPEPHFVWKPESMSDAYRFELEENYGSYTSSEVNRPYFYVWDHVALALHVGDKVLSFEDGELRNNLSFCERDVISVPPDREFMPFKAAKRSVHSLWPHYYYFLQKFNESDFHITE